MKRSLSPVKIPRDVAHYSAAAFVLKARWRRIAQSTWRTLIHMGQARAQEKLAAMSVRWAATSPELLAQMRATGVLRTHHSTKPTPTHC
jgi:hypothetical protein